MIEIALRLGLEHLLETEKFQTYFQSIATSNYSFDQMFARSIRLESQFHILMETLEDGVVGVNEKGEVFACNRHAEEITRTSADLVVGKPASQVFPHPLCQVPPGAGAAAGKDHPHQRRQHQHERGAGDAAERLHRRLCHPPAVQ